MKKLAVWGTIVAMVSAYALGHAVAQEVGTKSVDAPKLISTAFAATGAKMVGYEVHDWVTVNSQYESPKKLLDTGKQVARALGITGAKVEWQNTGSDETVFLEGQFPIPRKLGHFSTGTVEIASLSFAPQPPQTVAVIRIVGSGDAEHAFTFAYSKVKQIEQANFGHGMINGMLFGQISRPLAKNARSALIGEAFATAGASVREAMSDTYTTSVSGFSADASAAYIDAGADPINLQVAFKEDNYKQVTKVLVGSPIITVEY